LKTWLFDIWRDTARRYSFEEYDAPVVEHVELYIRKAGEEVTQQLYDFKDKGDRHLSLRPEMTPSLARMVLARKNALPLPIKWFSIPQCWRYERMTRGRRREHYQWNMDIFGVGGVEAEAELLSAIVFSFERMGISAKDVGIKINSRKLLNDLMMRVGIPSDKWVATCVLVDKLDKVELVALTKEINELGLSMSTMEELVSLLQVRLPEHFVFFLNLPTNTNAIHSYEPSKNMRRS
jgi:histidyl-tRNA synthetase